ncbi:MAG: hypothetical protein ABI040_07530 [Rhodoferax sp.]
MSASLTSIKLPSDLVNAARVDAATFSRSIGGQVEHWANIGRAIEATPGFTTDRIRAALNGRLDAADLSGDEMMMFDDLLGAAMDGRHTPQARAFWAGFEGQPNTDL